MTRKDLFHDIVRDALEFDGWQITNDPLFVPTEGGVNFFIDVGAEKIIGAEKEGENIAVEIKSFDENGISYNFYEILGQFLVYKQALSEQPTSLPLFIAMPFLGYQKLTEAKIFNTMIQKYGLKFIIFDPKTKQILSWQV